MTKRILVQLAVATLGVFAYAQTPTPGSPGSPGTITINKTSSIGINAGALRCTLTTSTSGSSVSFYCYTGTGASTIQAITAAATIPGTTDKPAGPAVTYALGLDSVSVLFWRPATGQPVQWQATANQTTQMGVF